MSKDILDILSRIGLEKNIPVDTLFDALESALITASKKMLHRDVDVVEAELDRETGDFRVYANMEVVEEVMDEFTEISHEEAQGYVEDVTIGEFLVIDVTPENFGRIAAQSAKQVITQRIREAEREVIYDKYKNRTGDLIAGTVQRYEKGNVIIDLGNAEALLPRNEQPHGERYRYGDRVKAIIVDIRKTTKDAQIILSRTTPLLVTKLFEQEVAEIQDGIVSIRRVAREPGRRSKIAVLSSDSDVDPVGSCVGMKGSRVQMVVQELRGERIDIVEYSDDRQRFVANSLKPANIESVELNEDGSRALLVVRDDELALAIGKGGLNIHLASELTKVKIDVMSESQLSEKEAQAKRELMRLPSMTDIWCEALLGRGIITLEDVLDAGEKTLSRIDGIDDETAALILNEARNIVGDHYEPEEEPGEEDDVASSEDENVQEDDQVEEPELEDTDETEDVDEDSGEEDVDEEDVEVEEDEIENQDSEESENASEEVDDQESESEEEITSETR